MEEFFKFMTLPILTCFVISGIHAYLGFHVIEREVIFVDLALAQLAALGGSMALILNQSWESNTAYGLSLLFTLAGALVFSLTRTRNQTIPQEAMIGITYAVSAALLLLILCRSGEGDEHIRHALSGNILLVNWQELFKITAIYAAIGVFHFIFRDKFLLISKDASLAYDAGIRVRLWDFLFYASFGIVVTNSVKLAGVLLVFSYLVVPSCCALLFSNRLRTRLFLGWTFSLIASVLGMMASYFWDLPTGESVVCVFGSMLLILGVTRGLIPKNNAAV